VARNRIHPTIRRAVEGDLPDVVRLFAIPNDGNVQDENPSAPLDPCYADALARMAADPNNALLVAEVDGSVVGVFQFTVIQHVAFRGGRVAQIENVVVAPEVRGHGIGETMMRWAVDEARRRGCFRVQLTSNKVRKRAIAFYERLGFVVSHEGLKLSL
jgi:ribosomal protein S18 acetylase RimI-like enzyme